MASLNPLHTERRIRTALLSVCIFLLASVLAGCGQDGASSLSAYFKDPNGRTIKTVLKTTVPLAYSASVAMSAATGTVPANASVTNICSSYPCAAVVTIQDDDSAMPLRLGNFGTIHVYGYWTSKDEAVLTVAFGSDAGSSLFPVHDVNVFPVFRDGSSLRMVYVNVDVNQTLTDPGSLSQTEIDQALTKLAITASNKALENLDMDAWVIEADTKNTSGVSDDTYTISGAGTYIASSPGTASVHQLAAAQVLMGPDCSLNPVSSGAAVLQEIDAASPDSVLGQAVFGFHDACDGTATVIVGNGNYLLSTGKSIPLHLDRP